MGRWLEIYRERLPDSYDEKEKKLNLVEEYAPHLLLSPAKLLGRRGRKEFPFLTKISVAFGDYDGEELWLSPGEAAFLVKEIKHLLRICHYEEFIPGLEGNMLLTRWKQAHFNSPDFEKRLFHLIEAIEKAVEEQYWLLFLL